MCKTEGCRKSADYGFPDGKRTYCCDHKQTDMVNLAGSRCQTTGCPKGAFYGFIDGKRISCSDHKQTDMVNLSGSRCQTTGCPKSAIYGFIDGKRISCSDHVQKDMVNLSDIKCYYEGCPKSANFGFSDGKKVSCKEHVIDNMVNLSAKICDHPDCTYIASFALVGEKATKCDSHKLDNMINVRVKICSTDGCPIRASFGFVDGKATKCEDHKITNMVNIASKKCSHPECTKQPKFGFVGQSAEKCRDHILDNMVNVTSKKCLLCPVSASNPLYNGYCLRCFIYTFPDQETAKHYKIKEVLVCDFIKETYPDENAIFDKTTGGCSKRRPDALIDKYTHTLIVECDEMQHSSPNDYYSTNCEVSRINELYTDLADRPIVFIRFNPDAYIDENNVKKLSSFKYHNTNGVPIVRNQKEWQNRLEVLKNTIDKHLTEIPIEQITTVNLFFDKH
jgi:hypothetical protein